MTRTEIRKLSPVERVANYLLLSAQLGALGAKLRHNGRNDNTWTKEEDNEWEAICDQLDNYWHELSNEEHSSIKHLEATMGSIARGEWPLKLTCLL